MGITRKNVYQEVMQQQMRSTERKKGESEVKVELNLTTPFILAASLQGLLETWNQVKYHHKRQQVKSSKWDIL